MRKADRRDRLVEAAQQCFEIGFARRNDAGRLKRAAKGGGNTSLGGRALDPDQSAIHLVGLLLSRQGTNESHLRSNGRDREWFPYCGNSSMIVA